MAFLPLSSEVLLQFEGKQKRGNTQASGKCCSSIWPCLDFSTHSKNITPAGRSQGNSKYTRNNINKGSMDVWKNFSRRSCKVRQQSHEAHWMTLGLSPSHSLTYLTGLL
ncbi:Hypothetical predicted protein [Podarcis lilfordi]|uniref:Uncharacterized protein n=1 Tax=Podarcis lilfordi TaxID=74358 RepID=A0AA35JSP9_9SAUR|nr:Hypothetical predicted protein [Podarcis lilfordi]